MKQITKALGIIGTFALVITTAYFLYLYSNLTQLILVLGFAGGLCLAFSLWVIERTWILFENLDETNEALDKTLDYAREHIEKTEDEIKIDNVAKKLKKELGK